MYFKYMAAGVAIIIVSIAAPQTLFAQSVSGQTAEEKVRSYFTDIPVFVAIADCESDFTQFNRNGSVLHGGAGKRMIGLFQIDEILHRAGALRMGFDINTVAGNMGYARYLYNEYGTSPWLDSMHCWADMPLTAEATALQPNPLIDDLMFGAIDPQVITLQKILNANGFALATSGAGAPGRETGKFGTLTLSALQRFQCAKGIACSGDAVNGYGTVNAITRQALLALSPVNASATSPAVPATTSRTLDVAVDGEKIAQLRLQINTLTQVLQELVQERTVIAQG